MNNGKKWQRNELILALYLYHQLSIGQYVSNNKDVIKLANFIDRTP